MSMDVIAPSSKPAPPAAAPNVKYGVTYDKNYQRGSNNNPTNIKVGSLTQKWIDSGKATIDPIEAQDGGHFLRFKKLSDGLDAIKDLLSQPRYSDATVDHAMSTWSDESYDAAELGLPELSNKKVSQLSTQELDALVKKMAHYESGFNQYSPTPRAGGGK